MDTKKRHKGTIFHTTVLQVLLTVYQQAYKSTTRLGMTLDNQNQENIPNGTSNLTMKQKMVRTPYSFYINNINQPQWHAAFRDYPW